MYRLSYTLRSGDIMEGLVGICSPRRRLCPPHFPLPRQKGKTAKINHFQQIFGFLPSQNRILPPQCPPKFWCRRWLYDTFVYPPWLVACLHSNSLVLPPPLLAKVTWKTSNFIGNINVTKQTPCKEPCGNTIYNKQNCFFFLMSFTPMINYPMTFCTRIACTPSVVTPLELFAIHFEKSNA